MKGSWWKLGGVLIFIYVLIGGLTIPIRPGINSVQPSNAQSGEKITLEIKGYNTHFDEVEKTQIWLKLDSLHAIRGTQTKVIDANILSVDFDIPKTFPAGETVYALHLILDNEKDGAFVQPNALFVNAQNDSIPFDESLWLTQGMSSFHDYAGIQFPYRSILNETIRNTFFHVALWFAMFILLLYGLYYSFYYLKTGNYDMDRLASSYTNVAILFGILGIITGSIWAKFTWNTFWTNDIKLNMTAIALLIYFAYLILRGMNYDQDKRARLSAIYNIFAFITLIPLVFIIPRMTDSLHPGNGGNPALGGEDLDHTLRMFFYPSIVALFLIGKWMAELMTRFERIKDHYYLKNVYP
ncbi:MAG: cytochrome c biogenesis protein CcsA [Saprospiraceae bacterium]